MLGILIEARGGTVMAQAMLIAGNSKRRFDEAVLFKNFLEERVGIVNIRLIFAAYTETEQIEKELKDFLAIDEPAVLLYDGHGGRTGWCLDDARYLKYKTLTAIVKQRTQPLVVINSCCHSFSLVSYLETSQVSEQAVSIIASSSAEDVSYQGIVKAVIEAWNEQKPYQPPLETPVADSDKHTAQPKLSRFYVFCGRARRYWMCVPARLKSYIVNGRIPHNYCDEEILNFWEHLRSRILHRITFGWAPIITLRIRLTMGEEAFVLTVKEIDVSMRSLGAKRWGAILDYHFFPPKEVVP